VLPHLKFQHAFTGRNYSYRVQGTAPVPFEVATVWPDIVYPENMSLRWHSGVFRTVKVELCL